MVSLIIGGQNFYLILFPNLSLCGASVLKLFARNSIIDISKPGWANKVASLNLNDLRQADGLFAIVNGCLLMRELWLRLGWLLL